MKPPILLSIESEDPVKPKLDFMPRDFVARVSPVREAMFNAYALKIAVWGPLAYLLTGASLVSFWNDLKIVFATHKPIDIVAPIIDATMMGLLGLIAYRATSSKHLKEESVNAS